MRGWPADTALPEPEAQPLQKNWLPFVHGGELLVEYSVEPRAVLRVDAASGSCTPLHCCTACGLRVRASERAFLKEKVMRRLRGL